MDQMKSLHLGRIIKRTMGPTNGLDPHPISLPPMNSYHDLHAICLRYLQSVTAGGDVRPMNFYHSDTESVRTGHSRNL